MTSIRIEMNRAGVGDLLRSDAVQQMLNRKAAAVAAAASSRAPMVDGQPGKEKLPVTSRPATSTSTRARAIVEADHPAALAVEAKHRLLVGALDAARSA